MQSTIDMSKKTQYYIDLEEQYGAHNYHPIPVVLSKGEGVYVWDVDGKRYFDFLSAYSALNHGHNHPEILKIFIEQAQKLTLLQHVFYSEKAPVMQKLLKQTKITHPLLVPRWV